MLDPSALPRTLPMPLGWLATEEELARFYSYAAAGPKGFSAAATVPAVFSYAGVTR
jgi:hypothetical protein